MPLKISRQPTQTATGIVVPMVSDDGKEVTVVITNQSINKMATPDKGGYMERFSAFRGEFAKVACNKLALGRVDPDGKIYVSITDLTDPELNGEPISN